MADSKPGGGKANRSPKSEGPVRLDATEARPTPTDRIETLARDQIAWLKGEVARQRTLIEALQSANDRLRPEVARLAEALDSAQAWNAGTTILVTIGGALVSYATFADTASKRFADFGVALVAGGLLFMLLARFARRPKKEGGDRGA